MAKDKIKFVRGREILDSNGFPTVEVLVALESGQVSSASVPSGASTGEHEAWELRDNDPNRFGGKGVLRAVEHVNQDIASVLTGMSVSDQKDIDKKLSELDGTPNKGRLGANAILGASLACVRAASEYSDIPLYRYLKKVYKLSETEYKMPVPMFNIFNGGKHADTNLDIQEFMIVPHGIDRFSKQVRLGAEIYHKLGKVLVQKGLDTDVGCEGGYAPDIDATIDALRFVTEAISNSGATPGSDVGIALDIGASTFYDDRQQQYIFKLDESFLSTDQLISLYLDWMNTYPLMSIEDGLDENDWPGWRHMTEELTRGREDMLVVGDDIFVTNTERLKRGVSESVGNAVVVKPNQVGTVSETIECALTAREADYKVVVSQRSGETTDTFISDFAVAVNADFIKAGSFSRGERVCKYNRLLAIEEEVE